MIQLARAMLFGKSAQTVAIVKAVQLSATEVFVIFRRSGGMYGDIFTASGAEIDTVTGEVAPGENNYLQAVVTAGATADSSPDITAAQITDQTRPTITLVGDEPQAWTNGVTPYVDPGATATDDIDGDLTASIVADSSTVDVDTEGAYTVTYNVVDSAGNAATQVTRTVNVSAAE